jgi:hypothetical protein
MEQQEQHVHKRGAQQRPVPIVVDERCVRGNGGGGGGDALLVL